MVTQKDAHARQDPLKCLISYINRTDRPHIILNYQLCPNYDHLKTILTIKCCYVAFHTNLYEEANIKPLIC